jgi:ribose transport system substrate-binding protein
MVTLILAVLLAVPVGIMAAEPTTIGLALGWTCNEFGVAIQEEAQVMFAELFPDTTIITVSTEYNAVAQLAQIEDFIQRGVDAILITPADPTALIGVIQKADEAGIPVFQADSYSAGAPVQCVAMSGSFAMGYADGMYIGQRLTEQGGGQVATIDLPDNSSWYARTLGCTAALSIWPDVELVASYMFVPGGVGALSPKEGAKNMLRSYPEIDAFFCSWDEASIDVANLLMEQGRTDVFVVGIDGFENALDLLRQGDTPYVQCIAQSPRGMTRQIIQIMRDYFDGKPIPRVIDTPCYAFTPGKVPPAGDVPFSWDDEVFIIENSDLMLRAL